MLDWLIIYFNQHNIINARYEAELILAEVCHTTRLQLLINYNQSLTANQLTEIKSIIKKRITGVPLAYIFGKCFFWKYNLQINEQVLIPRPDSETIVQCVIDIYKKYNRGEKIEILEIGTGSGALAISIAGEIDCNITASDIDLQAIKIAIQNKISVETQINKKLTINFIQSDLFNNITPQKCQLIFSNPPYVSAAEYQTLSKECLFEPKQALVAAENGLYFYKQFAKLAKNYLHENGLLILEHGSNQKNSIIELFYDWQLVESIKDFNNNPRVLVFKPN